MRKTGKLLVICGILAALTACGEAAPASNLAQDINLGTGGAGDAGKAGGNENEEEEAEQEPEESSQGQEGVFRFLYEGVILVPGEAFDQSVLPVMCSEVSEVPSCAFDGNDNVYNYEVFELTAYIDENGQYIYSIYFMDPNLPTTEGLYLGDTVDDMKALYGENYEADGTAYIYTKGNTLLSIVTQNDIVIGIEYRLDK